MRRETLFFGTFSQRRIIVTAAVLLTRRDTGHMRSLLSADNRSSSVPRAPPSQSSEVGGSRSTGMRLWIARVSALASVTMIVHDCRGLAGLRVLPPVSQAGEAEHAAVPSALAHHS